MSDATIEVGGEVYTLTNPTYYAGEAIEGMTQTGRRITGLRGEPFIEASVSGWEFATVVIRNNDPREAIPCRVTMGGGVVFTARACAVEWSPNPPVTQLRIENLVAIPATPAAPTLDELTDPADLDWGTIRSTCAARDWRAAWGVVGTDHTGDATPGEVYLLAVARRASATAAALHHWRKAEMESGTIFIGADAAQAWQRIKRIAAWESSARAQYDERGNRRGRLQAAVRERYSVDMAGGSYDWDMISTPRTVNNPFHDAAMQARLYGRDNVSDDTLDALRQLSAAVQAADTTVRPTNMWIDEATLNALRQRAEDDAVTRGNGGVVGVLNNPYLSAAAQRGEITGTVTLTASEPVSFDAAAAVESELRHQLGALIGQPITQATRARAEQIAANVLRDAQRTANPAPRGPQTRKRR